MRRCGIVCAVMAGFWAAQAGAASGGVLPEWVRFSDGAKRYTEESAHSAAGNEHFISLDIDVSYPNYKIIQRVQREGNYAEVARRDGYGAGQIEGPAVEKRILQAFHGFLSIDDEYELGELEYQEDATFPRGNFRIVSETVVASAPGGQLRVERDCQFVETVKAETLVSRLPGDIHQYRCDSNIAGTTTPPPVLHFFFSDYLDMVINRYYDHEQKDELTNMENNRELTFIDSEGQKHVARYSNFPI
ncbi:hypothetical protein [Pseudomonas matsuisoli]|uniref:Uncharacterized protein n=1 Tax=Pseudomonas matsuisoli TaxID=1515666 RepID=A0A917PYX3_9PSED|nr:hypothetical protein [Pseudomonas matsuisoli]GGK00754.1 hypothetical protein GCM10009304_28250 [Pseudomonas matsuisoli]